MGRRHRRRSRGVTTPRLAVWGALVGFAVTVFAGWTPHGVLVCPESAGGAAVGAVVFVGARLMLRRPKPKRRGKKRRGWLRRWLNRPRPGRVVHLSLNDPWFWDKVADLPRGFIVYRLWDAAGMLLYIGKSRRQIKERFEEHAGLAEFKIKPWWPQVRKVKLVYFVDDEAMGTAETTAIGDEHPVHNIAHSGRKAGAR